jgi:hypothetical protein
MDSDFLSPKMTYNLVTFRESHANSPTVPLLQVGEYGGSKHKRDKMRISTRKNGSNNFSG